MGTIRGLAGKLAFIALLLLVVLSLALTQAPRKTNIFHTGAADVLEETASPPPLAFTLVETNYELSGISTSATVVTGEIYFIDDGIRARVHPDIDDQRYESSSDPRVRIAAKPKWYDHPARRVSRNRRILSRSDGLA